MWSISGIWIVASSAVRERVFVSKLSKWIMIGSLILLASVLQSAPIIECSVHDPRIEWNSLRVTVELRDIDSRRQTALLSVFCSATLYPGPSGGYSDVIGVNLDIFDKSGPRLSVQTIAKCESGVFYQGAKVFEVPLPGSPMLYPYDSYYLNFSVWVTTSLVPLKNVDIGPGMPYVRSSSLTSAWRFDYDSIPALTLTKDGFPKVGPFIIAFHRTETAIYKVVLPLYSIFFLLGATLLLDPREYAQQRFTLYLAVFIYVLSFPAMVAEEMPIYTPAMGELLAYSLIVSTTGMIVLTALSLCLKEAGRFLDLVAALFSLFATASMSRISREDTVIYSILDLPSYVILVIAGGLTFGLFLRETRALVRGTGSLKKRLLD